MVPPNAAAFLVAASDGYLGKLRRESAGRIDVDGVLRSLRRAAAEHADAQTAPLTSVEVGSERDAVPEVVRPSLTRSEVATVADCTKRTVRLAVQHKQLVAEPGRDDRGGYRITPTNAVAWIEARRGARR
jgi:hypothetical protein